jgi:23S rRNA pseudouridine1911/1915/1917 synthase
MSEETGQIVFSGEAISRLDAFLAASRTDLSRSRWQELIKDGRVLVNGKPRKPNHSLRTGDAVSWDIPPPVPAGLVPENIPLNVLYEDQDLIVLNKPPGIVVHPSPGHSCGTLVHGLLFHCDDLAGIGGEERPGIVHRLDRDTSGCMLVAKTEQSMSDLSKQFKARDVKKEYVALVWGRPSPPRGTIRTLIARDPRHRQKMSANVQSGRDAVTHYEVVQPFDEMSFVRVKIETGRTHQIRVHMAHIRHSVVGDAMYGRPHQHALAALITRQMLHAERIAFTHPRTHIELEFTAPIPADFRALLTALRESLEK